MIKEMDGGEMRDEVVIVGPRAIPLLVVGLVDNLGIGGYLWKWRRMSQQRMRD